MPEPLDPTRKRGAIESILRRIPGFRGYREKEHRREADALQRDWLADRLQRSKRGLDDLAGTLANAGQIDLVPPCDRLRGRLDKLIGRIRGTMQGDSVFFDPVQVDEAVLDRVYRHDAEIMDRVEELAEEFERLPQAAAPEDAVAQLTQRVGELDRGWDLRVDVLKGLE